MSKIMNNQCNHGCWCKALLLLALIAWLAGCANTTGLPLQQQAQWQEQALQYYRHGDLLAAESVLQQLLKEHPKDAESWFLLGNIQLRQLRIDAARSAYEQALAAQPTFHLARYNLALTYLRLATLTLIHENQPEDTRVEHLLEQLLRLQGANNAHL